MGKLYLLENENVHRQFQPHPLSFLSLQAIPLFILIWGLFTLWLMNSSYHTTIEKYFPVDSMPSIAIWWVGLLIGGTMASLLLIRWRIFFLYLGILILGTVLMYRLEWTGLYNLFIPIYSVIISFLGFIFIDIYRRSHKYYITNCRLVLRGGLLKKRERSLRYDKITDIEGSQSIIGFLFHFGSIIPITQSGFGLGSDASFAGAGVGINTTKKMGLGLFTGGEKELQTPRTRSYYQLQGAYPYKELRAILENLIQENTIAPYQKQQVELQRKMVELLRQQQ